MSKLRRPKVVAIVQARVESTRFPGKVLAEIAGSPLLAFQLNRVKSSAMLDGIVLAIPQSKPNDSLVSIAHECDVPVFRGSSDDVLDRYYQAAFSYGAEVIVRLTADCPLSDPDVIDLLVRSYLHGADKYCATGSTFPDGLDVEVFSFEVLEIAHHEAKSAFEREHVTPFIKSHWSDSSNYVEWKENLSHLRITVDEPEDLGVVKAVVKALDGTTSGIGAIAELSKNRPDLFQGNEAFTRDEGATMNKGQKLWRRAKRVIPGGGMLFSKRAEQFSPSRWPTYFSRAVGCRVWDLDGREYLDVGYMGVGTNILGYNHPKVQRAVMRAVEQGNLSTLNAPEEVQLAEQLVELHPWSDMVKFTRSGGEACAIAIRIARAASGKDGVAFCGYHGWHDWYLSANLGQNDSLRGHLLPGLLADGVPLVLQGTSFPFEYGSLSALRELLVSQEIGVIFMEVQRNIAPADGYLQGVRQLADEFGAVVVFDENTSGFRQVLGGLHLERGVDPDIAVFGKTLGNGYAVNAIVGKRSVMEYAERSFVSSTFWTERIGSVAGLSTLEAMRDENAPNRIHEIGLYVRENWHSIAREVGLELEVQGLPALSTFSVTGFEQNVLKTFVVEKMLDFGFLAPPAFYSSIAHSPEVLEPYFVALAKVMRFAATLGPDGLEKELASGAAVGGLKRSN